jgi:hypothetical protein
VRNDNDAIALVQELLILAFQRVVEDGAAYAAALSSETRLGVRRRVDLGVL